ncbi:hypothetical protein [Allobranchiibius sp. GilTou73]|uniref:hypothetical protein n=1 Tax=Allobranchiibius sp. GilTou73 TaxID=2904523 RepID=UPI001F1E152E|nr:hypothetical protein [Allobranchiibius sp. GilTou73]UIJ35432.1 hypothetical protein LVQ62_03305 [Allobranchiibius sp. GilTou73]
MDDLIAGTGVAYRSLANPGFMDNLLRQVDSIGDRGVFTDVVTADRRTPMVATRDIADAAARLLLDTTWSGVDTVPVLGPEDLSPQDMAGTMSEVLGTPIRYERESYDAQAARMSSYGVGAAFVRGMTDMMSAKEAGLDAGVARTPETASPTTFRQWCEQVLKPAVSG